MTDRFDACCCLDIIGIASKIASVGSVSGDDEEEDTSPVMMPPPPPPPFLLAQPTASQQESNNKQWEARFKHQQAAAAQQAVACNSVLLPLPPGMFPPSHMMVPNAPPQKKAHKEKKQPKEVQKDLPPALAACRHKNRNRFTREEQMDTRNKADPGPHKVAKCIVTGRGENEKRWDLEELTSLQLQKLAINFGCKGAGRKTKFQCRQRMALCKDGGTLCQNVDVPNPTSSAQEKKLNMLMRVLNAAFSPTMVDRLAKRKDTKNRKDFEQASGGSPVKMFFADLSEMVNDTLNNEELK